MPTLAILTHELSVLTTSWLVRLWLVAAVVGTFLVVAGNWASMQSAPLVASVMFSFLVFPWFLVVIVLGISPVTGTRLDALADGILSRPVTRHEYLFAALLARILVVLGVFVVVTLPAVVLIVFAKRPVSADGVTFYGVASALVIVSLVLTFLVTLAFFAGTLLRNALLAAVVMVFVWFPVNLILHTFSLEEFSPISLSQALPTLLRTSWSPGEAAAEAGGNTQDLAALARQTDQFLRVLSGGATPARQSEGSFFEKGDYRDFSVWRVLLGYGLPTLMAFGLSVLFFCWRDL
jgi:ABC-type transport system involved in multi-copper enzyme maturation permease subunit